MTIRQRVKETSADYRYFPDPDLPPIHITEELINEIRLMLVELPIAKKKRFMNEYSMNDADADILVSDKKIADYTEQVISELHAWNEINDQAENDKERLAKLTSNWLISELFKHLKTDNLSIEQIKITPAHFAELISLIFSNKINSSAGQTILEKMYQEGGSAHEWTKNLGLEQIQDDGHLEEIVKEIIIKFPTQVEQFKSGKEAIIQFLVGQGMAATKGKANPAKLQEIFKKLI